MLNSSLPFYFVLLEVTHLMSPRPFNPSHGDEEMQTPEKLEFEKLLAQYDYAFKRGEIVRGTIIALESNGALVDIGAKTAAFLPNKEVASPYATAQQALKTGDDFDFFI